MRKHVIFVVIMVFILATSILSSCNKKHVENEISSELVYELETNKDSYDYYYIKFKENKVVIEYSMNGQVDKKVGTYTEDENAYYCNINGMELNYVKNGSEELILTLFNIETKFKKLKMTEYII